jgi:transposase
MRGKKGEEHFDPNDPPRRRANQQRGRGTYANDRPPILGTVGRESGQVRLRVVMNTTGATLQEHSHRFT